MMRLSRQLTICYPFFSFLLLIFILSGCASSDAARDAADNIDLGVRNAKKLAAGVVNGDIADSYQNTSQTAKGVLFGSAAGAITGAFVSSVGVLPGTAMGLIMGGAYGSYIDSQTTLLDRLENRGVQIVIIGDQILMVIPSARIFRPYTADIKPSSYKTIAMIATFINLYTKMLVKVSAYTNDTGSPRVDAALSAQQSKNMANMLIASGVNARLLYAAGCGGSKLVAPNSLDWDESPNYRIEITFEKLYV